MPRKPLDMDHREWIEIGIWIASLIGVVAATRAGLADLKERVRRLERSRDKLPEEFVPRAELNRALKSIESVAKHTRDMLQAYLFGRGHTNPGSLQSIEAAAQNFVGICIHGLDGTQGLNLWEGRTSFLYLDNRRIAGKPAPLVTVGVGCAIELAEALTLPWEFDGRPATRPEIMRDFEAIQLAPFNLAAESYAHFTVCRLPEAAIDALVNKRFVVFIAALRRLFPGFDEFPEPVKAGCLDLIYGLGVAGLSPPHYPVFRAGVVAQDWHIAASDCGSDEHIRAYDARNQARRELFLQGLK